MKLFVVYIAIIICFITPSVSYADWESSIIGLLEKFDEEKLTNHPIISLWYGTTINDNTLLLQGENFTNTYNLGIEYGFVRVKNDKTTNPYYLHFGERVFFENQSSHLKPRNWKTNGKTIDGWIFGLKAIDGLGIISQNLGIEFQHSSSLIWTRFDFEDYFKNIVTNSKIQKFDQQYKFGRDFGYGLSFQFHTNFQVGLTLNHNFIYPEFEFEKWITSYLFEIGLQKWMDFFDTNFQEQFGSNYWAYKYIYKSIVSTLIAIAMKEKPYLFFKTDRAFYNNSFIVKISYIAF